MNKRLLAGLLISCIGVGASGSALADRLDDMISPIANPLIFEDPRIISELRPAFAYHEVQKGFVTGGGDVQLYALQARFALTDRLALIATKDGYIDFNPEEALTDETGWGNVAGGLKYAFYEDRECATIATAGLRYEIPMGNTDVFQGNGDGSFNPFLSGAMALGPINLMSSSGFRFAVDSDDSSFFDFNLAASTQLFDILYPTIDVNLVHVLDAGSRLPIADEGFDLFNFGSSESEGITTVLGSAGARLRLASNIDWGVAYQFPLTQGEGSNLTKWRITTDLIYRFNI
ncbi:MAG: hypothetical protein QY326_04310 [Bdellovibrionota bacterium]|nr:MAG: hypothetical protein QY326_04310 [Bdellovibrionota bacterium]